MLPFLARYGNSNFLMDDAVGTISFVGLSEVVKTRVGGSIYTKDGIKYISKLLRTMKEIIQEEESKYDMRFKLAQKPCDIGSGRLAHIDREKFGKNIICAENISNLYYTDIPFIPLITNLSLRERIEIESSLQKILPEGCFTLFTLNKANIEKLCDLNKLVLQVGCKSYTYTKEFSHCNRCQTLSHRFLSLCPKCGNNNLTHIGRASALLQPTYIWPEFKLKSCKNWKYHTL
jgi:anaerobic ribonucleoside-triphosphate reductase